jgi:RNA polymerase sigma factor (sigma-70 family)
MEMRPMATTDLNPIFRQLRRTMLRDVAARTDEQLLESFVHRRDDAALAALVYRHGPMVWGVCRRVLRSDTDAEDAFQATFLVLLRKATTIRDRKKVANWLYGVAHQTAVRARTAAIKRSVRERQVIEMPEPAVAEREPWADLQPILDRELSHLPTAYRVTLVLCDLEGKTRQEVAHQLGWPEGTVASRLARARTMLAKRLGRHGLVVSSGLLAAMLAQPVAAVPPVVMASTIKAVELLAAGQVTAGVISPKVAALTEGVMKAMLLTKLRTGLSLALVLIAFGLGIGLVTHSALAEPPVKGSVEPNNKPPQPVQNDVLAKAEGHKERATLRGHTGVVHAVAFSPDGTILASGSGDHTIKLWDVATGRVRATLRGHTQGIRSVAFHTDGKTLASGSDDQTVMVWDVATGQQRATLKGHAGRVTAVVFSPDKKTLASGSYDHTVMLWDVTAGKARTSLRHAGRVTSVAFSPDGKTLASGATDTMVTLWEVASGTERLSLERAHRHKTNPYVSSVAFSPGGTTLASASATEAQLEGGEVTLWDLSSGTERASRKYPAGVTALTFSPDGQTLASAVSKWNGTDWYLSEVRLRRVTSDEEVTLPEHTNMVWSVAFSPDGKMLASASWDQTIKLWDVAASQHGDQTREFGRPGGVSAPESGNLSADELGGLWATLAGEDAKRAYQAINDLVRRPRQAMPLIEGRMRPASEPNVQQVKQIGSLIADLERDQFAARQQAREELAKVGEPAVSTLHRKLADRPSLEVQRQIEQLLCHMERHPETLRAVRAVEVLEQIGSPEAKRVLEQLAKGAEGFRLTMEAKAAVERLQKHAAVDK